MKIKYIITCILISLSINTSSANEKVINHFQQLTYTSDKHGLQFQYSNKFKIGEFKKENISKSQAEIGIKSPFNNAIVLIEKSEMKGINIDSIPVGERPTISINLQTGFQASFTIEKFCKDEFKTTIGKYTVFKLPGYPGPYGDQAFYYIIPLSKDKNIEFMAHRYYWKESKGVDGQYPKTHYDKEIESIIKTLYIKNP